MSEVGGTRKQNITRRLYIWISICFFNITCIHDQNLEVYNIHRSSIEHTLSSSHVIFIRKCSYSIQKMCLHIFDHCDCDFCQQYRVSLVSVPPPRVHGVRRRLAGFTFTPLLGVPSNMTTYRPLTESKRPHRPVRPFRADEEVSECNSTGVPGG